MPKMNLPITSVFLKAKALQWTNHLQHMISHEQQIQEMLKPNLPLVPACVEVKVIQ
jgi:hypothetical protein